MRKIVAFISAVLLSGASVTGCGDDEEDVVPDPNGAKADCLEICGRYDACVSDIDVAFCTDGCVERVTISDAIERQAESCENCLENQSCDEVEAAGCFDDCPVVLPAADAGVGGAGAGGASAGGATAGGAGGASD